MVESNKIGRMNLIASRQLDRQQSQVMYELTLKKRQSKKSTMSEKQVAARKQLAQELMQQRRDPMEDSLSGFTNSTLDSSFTSHNHNTTTTSSNDAQSLVLDGEPSSQVSSIEIAHTASTTTTTTTISSNHRQQLVHPNSPATSSCGCSFSRSDSSYSGSSQDSGTQMQNDVDLIRGAALETRKKEANIRFNKVRLQHLNGELERRLHQYEYLVAQEKALLGAYNMVLFTNEGVNNFHLLE